ncbi:MAG: hypothetical protein LUO98_03175 [Methanoregula sp.]|nr:hypothetical protein [Methanoregula sp.]
MAQSPDSRDWSKIFRITAGFTASDVTPATITLEYGYGPILQPAPGLYTGQIMSSDGVVLKEFAISDPRIWRGEEAAIDKNGRLVSFNGLLEQKERADTDIIFPYQAGASRFRIIESGSGSTKADIDLIPAVNAFCKTYSSDPDCSSRDNGQEGARPVPVFFGVAVSAVVVMIILHKKRST